LQDKLDRRFYTTTLLFAHDLCQAISGGINTAANNTADESKPEPIGASPVKNGTYSETRDRRRLAKRMLKALQPLLEAALRAEAEICNKPIDALVKELEGMVEASLEVRRPTITVSHDEGSAAKPSQDLEMADAPEEAQIIVADQSEGEAIAVANVDVDADDMMDLDDDSSQRLVDPDASIEVANASETDGIDSGKTNGTMSSNASVATAEQHQEVDADAKEENQLTNGFNSKASGSPPSLPGAEYSQQGPTQLTIGDPLTPPQSNGSFGRSTENPTNVLSEGGVVWYLKPFQPQGTSVVEEEWTGRQAVRSLSEELTDMDEETLEHLGFDVDDDTITASPVNATAAEKAERNSNNNTLQVPTAGPGSARKTRSSPSNFRKGVRTSARSVRKAR